MCVYIYIYSFFKINHSKAKWAKISSCALTWSIALTQSIQYLNCGQFRRTLLLFSRLSCYKCVGASSQSVVLCVNNQWGLDGMRSCLKWVLGGYPGREICSLHRQIRMEMSSIWCTRLWENTRIIDECKGWINITIDTLEKFRVQLHIMQKMQIIELPGIRLRVWHQGFVKAS